MPELLIHQAGSGVSLSKKESLRYFLEGTAGSHIESFGDDEKDVADNSPDDIASDGLFLHRCISSLSNAGSALSSLCLQCVDYI